MTANVFRKPAVYLHDRSQSDNIAVVILHTSITYGYYHSTLTILSSRNGTKKYYWNPHVASVTSHWLLDPRKIHVLVDCDVRSIYLVFYCELRAKIKFFLSMGASCTLQLERMLDSFNFPNITFYRINGVISADGQILLMSALLQSVPTTSVINNYSETYNMNY